MSPPQDCSLYNGVSNRSRGWKSKKTDIMMNGLVSVNSGVLRWDGAARASSTWDNLRRDPELWFRDGDCYVHLYGKGQSRRGPAFKVPFSGLLEADCYPLIDRFIGQDAMGTQPSSLEKHIIAYRRRTKDQPRVDLFIPAPPKSDKQQSYQYHLATRNFFAWIFRRSMVGEHLGTALTALLRSMNEFRTTDVDNLEDLISYMDEEGYLDFNSQPSHALAVLHMAEIFQLRDLYIDAFAHCCGMSDQLFLGPEYKLVSSVTRKLLRRARVDLDLRLGQTGSMLGTLLHDELSEAHLGLDLGARAHLEQFRTLLHGFYAAKFGYYPPPSIDPRATVFDLEVLRTMRTDFEALFEYLVDESFTPSQGVPKSAQGGICAFQSVQSFDTRLKFKTLNHALPLLPELVMPPHSRRMSWLGKHFDVKVSPSHRATAHVALLKATNQTKIGLLDNDLVRAYRKFEEDSIYSPLKADKQENIGLVDARKVRWILIYAIYQVLRQVTQPPPEVKDSTGTSYNLGISTNNLPPWKDDRPTKSLIRSVTPQMTRMLSTSTTGWSGTTDYQTPPTTPGIKPDIDYLALARHDEVADSPTCLKSMGRQSNITNGVVIRSLSIFGRHQVEKPSSTTHSRKPLQYHEIVVHGYGNGTNDVEFTSSELPSVNRTSEPKSERSPSTSSDSSISDDCNKSEGGSSATTGDTSVVESLTTASTSYTNSWSSRRSSLCLRGRARDIGFLDGVALRPMTMYETSSPPRPRTQDGCHSNVYSAQKSPYKQRSASTVPDNRRSYRKSLEPLPLNIRKGNTFHEGIKQIDMMMIQHTPVPTPPGVWGNTRVPVGVRASSFNDSSAWEMYNDLGGFTKLKAGAAVTR